jgi:hypothetical protein
MAVGKVGGTNPANVVRPLYGVFIRDQVAQLRSNISVTLQDLKAGIAAGDPKAKQVIGDGKLEGIEVAEAKKAATKLNKAINDLKPVFGGGSFPVDTARANMGRSTDGGNHPIAMYGVFLADDLRKYRGEIATNIQTINDGLKNGTLTGKAATEAKAALKALSQAQADLGGIGF